MNKFLPLFLLALTGPVSAANTFDLGSNVLHLDSLIIGATVYNDVTVRITPVEVLGVGSSAPLNYGKNCDTLTPAKYNAIQLGMGLDQVQSLLGCTYKDVTASSVNGVAFVVGNFVHTGADGVQVIQVWFDGAMQRVIDPFGTGNFKAFSG